MKRMVWLAAFVVVVIGAPDLTAWGDHGHEIVARAGRAQAAP